MPANLAARLVRIYHALYVYYGPQHWWPAQSPFEVIVGAILTQNTNWKNVEKAIANLRDKSLLTPRALYQVSKERLASLIKPSGYYNVKSDRLKSFLQFLISEYDGNLEKMFQDPPEILREKLLAVRGIGPETADSILLYAGGKPVFVVDAYTRRVLSRHGLCNDGCSYEEMQALFMENLTADVQLFNEYHALLVRVGKEYCMPTPNCAGCPLTGF